MVEGEEEYEVEEILDSRFRWGKLWYLVKFVRWSHSDNMWLPHMEVHPPAIVEEFHLQHPNAPHSSTPPTPLLPLHSSHSTPPTPLLPLHSSSPTYLHLPPTSNMPYPTLISTRIYVAPS